MRMRFNSHLVHAGSMERSILYTVISATAFLRSVVVVNCAPSLGHIAQSTGPSSGTPTTSASSVAPAAIYNGKYDDAYKQGVYLRIGNGGAGQSGLIGALADAFIQARVNQGDQPFEVGSK